jgi:hypothetical protein
MMYGKGSYKRTDADIGALMKFSKSGSIPKPVFPKD